LQRGPREDLRRCRLESGARLNALILVKRVFTRRQPRLVSAGLLSERHHQASAADCRACLSARAFTEPAIMEFFHDLASRFANGYDARRHVGDYGMTSGRPARIGCRPVQGMEIRIVEPDADGIGEVAVRSRTVMSHYLVTRNDGRNHRRRMA